MHHRTRMTLAAVVALGASAVAPASGPAATSTATGTISGGSLSLSTTATPSFSATLDGTDKTASYTVPFTLNDPTGTGNGWNATVTSTTFTTGSRTLPADASTVTGVTSSCAGGTCTAPTSTIGYPLGVPASGTAPGPAAVKLFNASASTGMGQFTVTPTVQVGIPANTYAGTYTSTLTLASVSGP